MSSPANSSLRPAWHRGSQGGGRGFQPPPAIADQRGTSLGMTTNIRAQSTGSIVDSNKSSTLASNSASHYNNKFAALDDDNEDLVAMEKKAEESAHRLASNSRSEGLRSASATAGASSGGTGGGGAAGRKGRSLADLAARTTERERSGSYGSDRDRDRSAGGEKRFSGSSGSGPNNIPAANIPNTNNNHHVPHTIPAAAPPEVQQPVLRYTREKLLSMRPPPSAHPSEELVQALEGSVILSETPQDPVCWDSFDAESIWATVARRTAKTAAPASVTTAAPAISSATMTTEIEGTRRPSAGPRREIGSSSGRWQRGVALPPPDEAKKAREAKDAENPSDLWDDPVTSSAAIDFSAFGNMPDDEEEVHEEEEEEAFDFEKMAEATRKFEEEIHGDRSRASSEAEVEEVIPSVTIKVDPKKPLATVGTTIQTGSLEEVNVFDDFDDPASESTEKELEPAIKAGDEDKNATSRLMAMIGVTRDPEPAPVVVVESSPPIIPTPAAVVAPAAVIAPVVPPVASAWGALDPPKLLESASVPLNPWGAPSLLSTQSEAGFDLQARLREAELEQQRAAELARRAQEEEQQRLLAQQQAAAEERARQQAAALRRQQQMQQAGVQSQVELVLMERISAILENSWGQSDLISVLATLHAEDSRVIPLLNTSDALRALILRNPRRVALRPNPVFGTEMAVLLMTNAQWQQEQLAQQQAEAHARSQAEELKRQQQQQRQLQEQRNAAVARELSVIPGAPWYYSDPQNNIQGPFRGEEMRQWLEAGYFKSDLPISQQQGGPFHPLSALFPDLSVAFLRSKDYALEEQHAKEKAWLEAERAEAAAKEAAEREAAERKAREAAERQRRAQEEAERERRAQEEAAAAAAAAATAAEAASNKQADAAINESSTQLKMILGLGSIVDNSSPPPEITPASKAVDKRIAKANKNNNQQQPKPVDPMPPVEAPGSSQSKNASSVWGGATPPVTRKSMSEIQKEEARAAAMAAMQRDVVAGVTRSAPSSGWANVAASRGGSAAWTGGAAKQRPAAVLLKPGAAPVPTPPPVQARAPQPPVAKPVTPIVPSATAPIQRAQSSGTSAGSNVAEEFGASMSPTLEKWCKEQMVKINGTDDLTLVSFCMTLVDPVEIRQYLTTYLGGTPQVNNFATEFISRKSGAKAQEEWESTANVKKSRKKKVGGR